MIDNEYTSGWITLHRKILEWEWFDNQNAFRLFIIILLLANWKDKMWRGIEIKRGQLLTSLETLVKISGLSFQQVRSAISNMQKTKEITIKTTNKNTLITILKYNDYQIIDFENNKLNNKQITSETTNEQQTNNKQITTTKEYNKENNVNKEQYISIFELARKSYLGTKKVAKTEFDNLVKKHKDWKEVLPLLLPAIQKEIEHHRWLKENNEFCPSYKNLQTWINQRCWEQEFTKTNTVKESEQEIREIQPIIDHETLELYKGRHK